MLSLKHDTIQMGQIDKNLRQIDFNANNDNKKYKVKVI